MENEIVKFLSRHVKLSDEMAEIIAEVTVIKRYKIQVGQNGK
jgi:hypothetical protein